MKFFTATTLITINNEAARSGLWSSAQMFTTSHPYLIYGGLALLFGGAAYLCLGQLAVDESAVIRMQKTAPLTEAIRINSKLRAAFNHTRLRLEQLRNDMVESQLNSTEHLINAVDALSQQASATDLVVRESAAALMTLSTQLLEVHATVAQLGIQLLLQ